VLIYPAFFSLDLSSTPSFVGGGPIQPQH